MTNIQIGIVSGDDPWGLISQTNDDVKVSFAVNKVNRHAWLSTKSSTMIVAVPHGNLTYTLSLTPYMGNREGAQSVASFRFLAN